MTVSGAITLELGLAGCHGLTGPSKWSKRGGSWSGYDPDIDRAAKDADDGCIVLDNSGPLEKDYHLAFSAPLVDISLPDDEVSSIDDLIQPGGSIIADAACAGPGNGFGTIVRGARAGVMNLDQVSLKSYVEWWRDKGARVGVVKDGLIEWKGTDR